MNICCTEEKTQTEINQLLQRIEQLEKKLNTLENELQTGFSKCFSMISDIYERMIRFIR